MSKHQWRLDGSPGLYDTTYICSKCGALHTESADDPDSCLSRNEEGCSIIGRKNMARKPENRFISSIHKHLPAEDILYKEKTHNPYRGGIPDWYYDGPKSDLWVEYKYHNGPFPKVLDLSNPSKKPSLTKLQLRWLNRRAENDGNAVVIYGCKEGVLILQFKQWLDLHYNNSEIAAQLLTPKETAEWIKMYTLYLDKKQ